MKIRIKKSRKSISLSLEAQGDQEGIDLKDVVLGMAKGANALDAITEGLRTRGYEGGLVKETRATREFVVSNRAPEGGGFVTKPC